MHETRWYAENLDIEHINHPSELLSFYTSGRTSEAFLTRSAQWFNVDQIYEEAQDRRKRETHYHVRARLSAVAFVEACRACTGRRYLRLHKDINSRIQDIVFANSKPKRSVVSMNNWMRGFLRFGKKWEIIAKKHGGRGALVMICGTFFALEQ